MVAARTFQVGDWVQVADRLESPEDRGRIVAVSPGRRTLYTIEFRPGDYPDVDGDWGRYLESELVPWRPTEEEVATWLITHLTN